MRFPHRALDGIDHGSRVSDLDAACYQGCVNLSRESDFEMVRAARWAIRMDSRGHLALCVAYYRLGDLPAARAAFIL